MHSTFKSFDVDLPKVEDFLRQYEGTKTAIERHVIGIEVI